ncbi:hypothetical protein FRB99_005658 [Tulasnella sp. 403]|nr:hypothetical protein FRB99_005658 [Tulasnella sp. 403]
MPYWPKTLNPHLPCATFLEAYPYPAFVLNKKQTGKLAASLIPIWSNSAYRYLVFGPKANEPQNIAGGGLLEALPGTGFEGLEEARKLANWVELLGEAADVPYLLELDPPWLPSDHPTIQLELTKTRIDPMWIITSTPRTPLPSHPPRPLVMDIPPEVARSTSFAIAPGPEPSHSGTESQSSRPTSPSPANPSRFRLLNPEKDPQRGFFTAGTQMLEYMRNYPWDTHVLGPMDSWPQSLKTTVGAVMSSPYPWALWWGPDLVLIYNDAYAVMAGTKHPQLFGQHGKIAWAEIWEEIGPLADIVMKDGKSIGYEDDRMFFDRLTDKRLPEEVYHSWTWIPVRVEGGKIGGMLNATTETTSKILYDRRIQILRSIGDKTALARSKAEFAEATQKVLTDDAQLDMPFVAFYFNTVDAPPKPTRTETTDYPPRPLALRVTSKLAYKIGVPDDHPAIPTRAVHYLDPITLKPRSIPPKRTGASPSSTVDASSLPDDTPTVVLSPPDVEEAEAEHPPTPEPQWPFFDIFSSKITLHIRSLPASIGEGFGYRPQGFNDVPREALIIPIAAEGDDVPVAVMIVGLNTRRPYDEEHRNWIDLLHMTLNSTLTAALGREAEVRKVEQLAQLDAAKTLFFSSASHELRTPLTLIAGPVDDAAEMTTEPRVKDLLKTSVRNIGRLSRLVDSLMDFSRLEGTRDLDLPWCHVPQAPPMFQRDV